MGQDVTMRPICINSSYPPSYLSFPCPESVGLHHTLYGYKAFKLYFLYVLVVIRAQGGRWTRKNP